MNELNFYPSFKGKFLNPSLVRKAAKKTEKAYINNACKNGNTILDTQSTAQFQQRAEEIISYLNVLAAKLPENMNLVLTKEKDFCDRSLKQLSLDVEGPLGRTEFMGSVEYHRGCNIPKYYGKKYDLGCVEAAIAPLSSTNSSLWTNSSHYSIEEQIVNKYISFIRKRIDEKIDKGSISKAQNMIGRLISFVESIGQKERAQAIEKDFRYKMGEVKEINNTNNTNIWSRLKKIFGIN